MNEKAKKALEEYRNKLASGEVENKSQRILSPIEKAKLKPTPMNCIKAKCFECMGGGGEIGTKKLIGACTASSCPLHPLRPYKSKHNENEEN